MNEVKFILLRYDENTDYRLELDPEDAAWITGQLEIGNKWAWCWVKVVAGWVCPQGLHYDGSDSLHGCSYLSREDFMKPGGYYDDMKEVAYDELLEKVKADLNRI